MHKVECTPKSLQPVSVPTRLHYHFTNIPCTTPDTRATPDHCIFSTDCTYLAYIFVSTVFSGMERNSTPRRVCGPRRTLLYIPVHTGHAGPYCTNEIYTRYVRVLFPYLSSHLQRFTVSRIPISDVRDPVPYRGVTSYLLRIPRKISRLTVFAYYSFVRLIFQVHANR